MLKLKAEDLDGPRGKRGKKGKKGRKGKKGGKIEYTVADDELMPAGLPDESPRRAQGGKRKGSDEMGLEDMDLSMPLGKDEKMFERQHRVVEAGLRAEESPAAKLQDTPVETDEGGGEVGEKGGKKSKKDKKKESKKKGRKEKGGE